MPAGGGLEFIKELQAVNPSLPIVVLSMHDELLHGERVIRAGARAYIMKEAVSETLLRAIRCALEGKTYVSPALSAKIIDTFSAHKPRGSYSPIEKLSEREFQIFRLIGEGKNTREIAAHFHLSPKTVDVYRARLKKKLEVKNATALVHYAVRWGESEARL
jgi:DNA-binding NarL/FixJ family response regulator